MGGNGALDAMDNINAWVGVQGQFALGGGWKQLLFNGIMDENDEPIDFGDVDNEGDVGMAPSRRQRVRRRVQPLVIQLEQDSYSIIEEYKSEEDDGTIGPLDANAQGIYSEMKLGIRVISLMTQHHWNLMDVGAPPLFMVYFPPYCNYGNYIGLHC